MHKFLLRSIGVLRSTLFLLLDGFLLSLLPKRVCGSRVLLVRLDAIGDFVLWLDAARTLVGHFQAKGHEVVLLGNKAWVSWARDIGLADEVWELDVRRFRWNYFYRWKQLKQLRRAGFDTAIQPTCSRVILEGDSVMRASGATKRIGSTGDSQNMRPTLKRWSDHWFTKLVPASRAPLMELKRNAEFMRGMGFADFKARLPTIPPAPSAQTNLSIKQPYAVIAPTASWAGRCWSIDDFAEIGQRLAADGLAIVVVGGSADRKHVRRLVERLPETVVDLVGRTTLGELAEVLRHATIVVANETGAVHIGAAVNAPVVCILGGGHFGRFLPYDIEVDDDNRYLPVSVSRTMACFGCNWRCIYPRRKDDAVKCIRDIPVEMVWKAVEAVLVKKAYRKV